MALEVTRDLAFKLLPATEGAAIAASETWKGQRGSGDGPDPILIAAIDAMHAGLMASGLSFRLIAAKGLGHALGRLFKGEVQGQTPLVDLAVDPIEGTSYTSPDEAHPMATLALAPTGAFFDPGPQFFFAEKLVAPPRAQGAIDAGQPIEALVPALAEALGKPPSMLRIFVMEKPRHRRLIAKLEGQGVTVIRSAAGVVAGAVGAALPEGPFDAMMGTGGLDEGLMAACVARALGAVFFLRLDPQLQSETRALKALGADARRWLSAKDVVRSDQTLFLASGIGQSALLSGVKTGIDWVSVDSLIVLGASAERMTVKRALPRKPSP